MDNTSKIKSKLNIIAIIRVISFILIIILVISTVYKVLSWKDTSGEYLSSVNQLYNTENNLIDVAFVGTSHVYDGIYPSILWNKDGISSFDMAISGQDKNSAYHSLVELLKTQSPQVVVVDIFAVTKDKYYVESNLYRNSLSLKPSINSYNLLTDIVSGEDIQSHFFRFPIIHTRYKELTRMDFETNLINVYSRGELYNNLCSPLEADLMIAPTVEEFTELSDANREWIDSLIELSKSENFNLVFFSSPFAISYSQQMIINGAVQYATEQGIVCLDFNKNPDWINLDINTDFMDQNHLNFYGAQKLSSWLSDWLSQNYDLADHRGDSKYYQWDSDLHLYYNYQAQFSMNATDDLGDVINISKNYSDYITVLYVELTDESELESYINTMEATSIEPDDFLSGGIWMCNNGVFEKKCDRNTDQLPYYETLTDSDILRLHYDAYSSATNISIGRTNYNITGVHTTVIVYDIYTQRVIYHGGQ